WALARAAPASLTWTAPCRGRLHTSAKNLVSARAFPPQTCSPNGQQDESPRSPSPQTPTSCRFPAWRTYPQPPSAQQNLLASLACRSSAKAQLWQQAVRTGQD